MQVLDLTIDDGTWRSFNFPDGQPHISLNLPPDEPTRLVARIASSDDLVRLLLARDLLWPRWCGLQLAFVMGGRMDRPMPRDDQGFRHPFTLAVVANCIKSAQFDSISVFDPHSDVTAYLLGAHPVLPVPQVMMALSELPEGAVLIAPDAGAAQRVDYIARKLDRSVAHCTKKRDSSTGKLSSFKLAEDHGLMDGADCLIVDDICDGGRTFTGIAEVLRSHGAASVALYVSHGVFSKGFDLEGIDRIFTTNSYQDFSNGAPDTVKVLPWLL